MDELLKLIEEKIGRNVEIAIKKSNYLKNIANSNQYSTEEKAEIIVKYLSRKKHYPKLYFNN